MALKSLQWLGGHKQMNNTGIVVIGRNEGILLRDSLSSALSESQIVVYVDSASDDSSVEISRELGVQTIILDQQSPLCAARARNAGAKHLMERYPFIEFIQFLDGDTVLEKGWLIVANEKMEKHPQVAIVSGVLNENNPDLTVFKKLSEMEWKRSPGVIDCCGGNMMIRVSAFVQIGGFNSQIIAGEDSEFCYRIRKNGWTILHVQATMGMHYSKIMTIRDFWKRSIRTGYGYQQISLLHLQQNEKLFLRENISNWVYGGILPIFSILLAPSTHGWSLCLLGLYVILAIRIYYRFSKEWKSQLALAYAGACVISKFAGFYGACKYIFLLK